MGGVTYTVDTTTSGKGPLYVSPLGYNCSRTRIFACDFIKDLLLAANDATNNFYGWSGYVDSTISPTTATMFLFKQGAKTYGSTITWAVNASHFKNTRNLLRTKNFIEFVGSLSPTEPPPIDNYGGDSWTEKDVSMWTANPGTVGSNTTHYCPVLDIELVNTPCYAQILNSSGLIIGNVLIDQASIRGIGNPLTLDLSLKSALGQNFNVLSHNATSLNFHYKLLIGDAGDLFLKDAAGNKIRANNGGVLKRCATSRSGGCTVWTPYGIAVGPNTVGTSITATWQPVSQGRGGQIQFDWGNVADIIFSIPSNGTSQNSLFYLDHLYFAQSYQPVALGQDADSIASYGQRMQYYDASMYFDDKSLKAYAAARTSTLSPALMDLDITTSLGPEAEASGKGFQPGFSFPAGNISIPNYNFDKVAWRALEVETHVLIGKESGLTTRFHLTPASGPAVGPNAARFDSRRFW
jgi:hypothetical protein